MWQWDLSDSVVEHVDAATIITSSFKLLEPGALRDFDGLWLALLITWSLMCGNGT